MPGGAVLGRSLSPYTFKELGVITAPFERNYMILLRNVITRANTGDYTYMVARAEVEEVSS